MLVFLKLGGSLITDKDKPQTARFDVIHRLCDEIAAARSQLPAMKLILGHGSGSFGHNSANQYGTYQGVRTASDWLGFAEVWRDARELNQIMIQSLFQAKLPVIGFPPSALVTARNRQIEHWDLQNMQIALESGLIPVVMGDVIFDLEIGGTILSTEELFQHLARKFKPNRILFAGRDEGVWEDFPHCSRLLSNVTPQSFRLVRQSVQESASVDVTGGMLLKVNSMLDLVAHQPDLQAQIFSGLQAGNLQKVLAGSQIGTIISTEQ
jgi:isopentenyl phosphate kinase